MPKKTQPESDETPKALPSFKFGGVTFVIPASSDDYSTEGDLWLARGNYKMFAACNLDIAKTGQSDVMLRVAPTRGEVNRFLKAFADAVSAASQAEADSE